jgi:CxxC motif-containing protein (DUF1111 family)
LFNRFHIAFIIAQRCFGAESGCVLSLIGKTELSIAHLDGCDTPALASRRIVASLDRHSAPEAIMRRGWLLPAMLWTVVWTISIQAAELCPPPGRNSPSELVEAGRQLFTMNFARPEQNSVATGGNGLGPMFNDTSCVACHNVGGIGGAGDLDSNVLLLGIVSRPRAPANITAAVVAARKIHPGFSEDSAVKVLHRFAVGHRQDPTGYDRWRDGILGDFAPDGPSGSVKPIRKTLGPVTLELAQRNTTALWGVGLIDRLRREGGDAMRRRLAEEQPEKHAGISGRIPKTSGGQEGWFGWRGQIATLDDFTLSACAVEMGLQVPGVEEDESPLAAPKRRRRSLHVDLSSDQCAALAALVHSLPRPVRQIVPEADPNSGERVFERVGCASCHVQSLGFVSGIYSDLLLHDMGSEMSDAQNATPDMIVQTSTRSSGYGGASISRSLAERPTSPEQEWKTPPLWGVGDSAPYLHDGRAATLKEAILMHAGEADRAVAAFRQLDHEDQQALLSFLNSLKAPIEAVAVAKR